MRTEAERETIRYTHITLAEAAKLIPGRNGHASASKVRRLVEEGLLQAVDLSLPGARRAEYFTKREWIDEFLERRTRKPDAAA